MKWLNLSASDDADGKEIKMALEKTVGVDQIEVVGIGTVQVREATVITEDGKQISKTYHRHCVTPGQDYSAEKPRVQAICAAVHTAECIAAYQAQVEANRLGA
jgi:hypothetical protein